MEEEDNQFVGKAINTRSTPKTSQDENVENVGPITKYVKHSQNFPEKINLLLCPIISKSIFNV